MPKSEDDIRDEILQYFYELYINRTGKYRGREAGYTAASDIANRLDCERKNVTRNLEYLVRNDWIEHIFEEEYRGEMKQTVKIHTYKIGIKGIDGIQGHSKYSVESGDKLNVGDDAVVIGDVTGNVGKRAVVIRSTDESGIIKLDGTMAIGSNAKSDGGIAIGPNAIAARGLFELIHALKTAPEINQNEQLISRIETLEIELKKGEREESTIKEIWSYIEVAVTSGGAVKILQQIGKILGSL